MKKFWGWLALLSISLTPFFLWLALGPDQHETLNLATVTQDLGELTALIGMTMFALTFVLSSRIKFLEDIFDGLDKVYIAHGILGSTAFILLLFHPLLLIAKFVPVDLKKAAVYLLPSNFWSVNFGIIALLGMILLIVITLFSKIKYQRWKFTHEFLGLVFTLAILHIFLVRVDASRDIIFTGYYWYATAVSLIGLTGFGYSLFVKDRLKKAAKYQVSWIKKRGADTYEITMRPAHKPLAYRAGQFIFVRFYNQKLPKEAHPFSIASASNERDITIVVKKLGDYTAKLTNLRVGDAVSLEGPYGRFHYHPDNPRQIWIAGGIGVTPFLGMAKDLLQNPGTAKKIDLYYTCHAERDFICFEDFEKIQAKIPRLLRVIPWQTGKLGHLSAVQITKYSGDLKTWDIYLSGPTAFKKSLIKQLRSFSVARHNIHTEEFDFR